MNDAIYLRKGNKLVEMMETAYEYESVLQEKLSDHPRLLAGGQMSDEGVHQWALIAHEKAVPDKKGGTGRWSADHLFVDQNAIPTIVEVKRSENTQIRREIVGQMFDYVAHASLFWDAQSLRNRFVETCEELEITPEKTIEEFVGEDETETFWDDVEKNLRSKKIRLVFVADDVPSELKRVVEFLNEAMSDVEVFAIEVVQYASDEETVFVPRLHGQTEEAKVSSSTSTSRTGSEYIGTEEEMYEDLEQKLDAGDISEETYHAFTDLYDFSKGLGDGIDIGGAKNANFGLQVAAHQEHYSGRPSVFTANVSGDVKVWPAKMPLDEDNLGASPIAWNPEAYYTLETAFQSLDGVPMDENSVSFETLTKGDNLEEFKTSIENFVAHCRDAVNK